MGLFGRKWSDVLQIVGAGLQDASTPGAGNLQSVNKQLAMRQAEAKKAEAQQALMAAMGGLPMKGGEGGLPSLRTMGPALLAARQNGIDISDYVSLLDKAGPQIDFVNGTAVDKGAVTPGQRIGVNGSNVNGTVVDMQDPASIGMQIPEMNKGQIRIPGANGLPMIVNAAGFVGAEAEREGAIAGAKARGTAPYEYVQGTGPQGEPVVSAKSRLVGGELRGQPREAAAFAQARGSDLAGQMKGLEEAAAGADSQLAILNEAKKLMPNVITGLGADARLNFERGMALIGDEKAKERVAATETFQATMARQVLDLVKQLGAGTAISNADREFATKVAGGQIALNEETINRLISIAERQAATPKRRLQELQSRVPGAAPTSGVRTQGQGFRIISVE